jgi:hypothetical protein
MWRKSLFAIARKPLAPSTASDYQPKAPWDLKSRLDLPRRRGWAARVLLALTGRSTDRRTARDGCGMTGPMARTEPDVGLACAGHPLQALFARARSVASAAAHAQCSGWHARAGGRASVRATIHRRIRECTDRGHRPVLTRNVAARRAIPLSRQRLLPGSTGWRRQMYSCRCCQRYVNPPRQCEGEVLVTRL